MILILGIPSEPPVAMLADALERAGCEFTMVNQREFLDHRLDVTIRNGRPQGSLTMEGRRIDIDDISAVYVRLSDHRVLPERDGLPDDDPRAVHIDRLHERWIRLLDVLPAVVVNRLGAMASNSSKPYQTELINRVGLDTPTTLVTSDPDAARHFIEQHRDVGGVIFKSVSGVRSIVRRMSEEDADRLDLLVRCPTQFQAFVPGDDVRVHVVGD
ncbi:MAG: RimK family alpha-L-glutamate ligase, partial [Ilumatobacter sp.]